MRPVLASVVLLVPAYALAWEHTGQVWDEADFPIAYQTNILEVGACGSVTDQSCLETVEQSWEAWELACLPVSSTYDGEVVAGSELDYLDDLNTVLIGDTFSAGVLGFSLSIGQQFAFLLDGEAYFYIDQTDIVLSEDVDWVTHTDVLAGDCDGQYNLAATAVHEVGHSLGLAHSCESGEPCFDAEFREAIMFWMSEECEEAVTPQADDEDGIRALYGAGFSFFCGAGGDEVFGIAPLTATCEVQSELPVSAVSWSFGDGDFGEGQTVEHTWTDEGLYDVRATVELSGEGCDETAADRQKLGYVRVCDVPRVSFEMDHVLGATWDIKNETRIDVLGCITETRWALYQGSDTSGEPYQTFEQWEYTLEFPEEGTWTLVLNVGGPAGTAAAQATLDVRRFSGLGPFGCAHGGAGAPIGWGLVLALMGVVRRRVRGA